MPTDRTDMSVPKPPAPSNTRKPTLYYMDTSMGCGIRAYRSIAQARKEALREVGTANFIGVRHATQEDVDHVRMMGGRVPDGVIKKATKVTS